METALETEAKRKHVAYVAEHGAEATKGTYLPTRVVSEYVCDRFIIQCCGDSFIVGSASSTLPKVSWVIYHLSDANFGALLRLVINV